MSFPEPSELALFSTQELIDELTRRTTFLGVVVHSGKDHKDGRWDGEKTFKVRFNANLNTTEVGRLLETVGDHISSNCGEDE